MNATSDLLIAPKLGVTLAFRHTETNSHDVVYQTGRTDLLSLVELGLLTVRKSGRAMVFRAVEDLEGKLANLAKGETPRPLKTEGGLPLNWSPPDEPSSR